MVSGTILNKLSVLECFKIDFHIRQSEMRSLIELPIYVKIYIYIK